MAERKYNLIVIGAGPGGYVAAIRAAQLGMKVTLVERDKLGGRCLNYACIPAKAMLRSADIYQEVLQAGKQGVEVDGASLNWEAAGKGRDRVVKTLGAGVATLMKKNGIEVIAGRGSLAAGGRVSVGGDELVAEKIVLATGSVPRPVGGVEFGGRVLDTANTWFLPERPTGLVVVGAGPSGCEIASAFARFGCDVTLVEMLDHVLPGEDEEVCSLVQRELGKQGVEVLTGNAVQDVDARDDGVSLKVGERELSVSYLCIATGRRADTDGLNLEETGIEIGENGLVKVDGYMRTAAAGVYAIGDLVPGPALAHKASEEGIVAAEDAAGRDTHPIDYGAIPRATFCQPQVASFGITEAEAGERGLTIKVGRFPYSSIAAATIYGDRSGFVKLVADAECTEILGAQIVGQRATELIAEIVATRALEGGFSELARIVHAHPTLSEGVLEAARDADGWAIHS